MNKNIPSDIATAFWSLKIDEAFKQVNSNAEGLNETEIKERRNSTGPNTIKSTKKQTAFLLFLNQFQNIVTIMLMLVFGILSSVFDYLTFGVLLLLFKAGETEFQTGWFIESVVLVVRSNKSFIKSKPGKYLLGSTLLIASIALLFPLFPFTHALGFAPLPIKFYLTMITIVLMYLLSAEILKRWFYKSFHNQ